MKRVFSILFALALVLSFSLVTATPVAAATINVPGDHATIQAAITAASSGDTIMVAAGTYNEAVKVDKSLTLKGAPGAIIQPDNTTPKHDGGKRRCGIYVAGVDNVTIEGFEIDGTAGAVHLGIHAPNSDNTVVKNNVIHDITNEIGSPVDDKAGLGISFFGWGQGIDGALIEGNTVYNTGRMGIIVCGMQSVPPWKWLVCSDNVIRNNTVHHAWQGPTGDYGAAVQINGAKNSVIEGNTIDDTCLNKWGIYITGSVASTPNHIDGNNIYSNDIGIVICSNDPGVDYGADSPGPPEVHFNNIYNNTTYGLENLDTDPTYLVNAENNWWGDASGPSGAGSGTGDSVSANVDFTAWLGAKMTDQPAGCTADRATGATASPSTDNVSGAATGGSTDTTVYIAEYVGNPSGVAPGFVSGDFFFDVHVDGALPGQLVVDVSCPGGDCSGMRLKWFDGTQWLNVRPRMRLGGIFRATLSDTSTPTIAQLTGTPFGLGNPPPSVVGWETYPINKLGVLLPWIALLAAIMAGASLLVLRRRRAQT